METEDAVLNRRVDSIFDWYARVSFAFWDEYPFFSLAMPGLFAWLFC